MVMFINMEIPFREVAHESYHEFMSLVSPWFKICSRFTLSCDILKLWDMERIYLESFFFSKLSKSLYHSWYVGLSKDELCVCDGSFHWQQLAFA
jgi:hypothetical protein